MDIVYHGSAEKLDIIEPRRNLRSRNGEVIWDAVSFHATPHRWIALAYTRSKDAPETTGVDLYQMKPVVEVIGSTTLEEALESLYGQGGYLYHFDAKEFTHAEGLGNLEVFSEKSVSPVRVEPINNPVAELEKEGVAFVFTKKENPKEV